METLHKWSGAAFCKPLHSFFELPKHMKNKSIQLTIYLRYSVGSKRGIPIRHQGYR
jgi:hypothetical protein